MIWHPCWLISSSFPINKEMIKRTGEVNFDIHLLREITLDSMSQNSFPFQFNLLYQTWSAGSCGRTGWSWKVLPYLSTAGRDGEDQWNCQY